MFIWINGAYVSDETPVISGSDRGFLYGDGLFETLRVYPQGQVFQLNEHLARLNNSAQYLKIPLPVSRRSFNQAINRLLKLNNLAEARVRITLSRGKRAKCTQAKPTIIIETEPCPDYTKEREAGVKCIMARHRRSVESPLGQHKTLNYLENILARAEARQHAAFETLFINTKNELAEGATSNVFIVKRGRGRHSPPLSHDRVFTPPLSANILPGITRQIVLGLCTGQAIPVREKSLRIGDLLNADEIFLTGSIIEIMPVVKCAGKKIGTGKPGRITQLLQKAYQTLTNG